MPRILVVYKKSQLQLYEEHESRSMEELRKREPALWERFRYAHDENSVAVEQVRLRLNERELTAQFVYRADYNTAEGFDLVVSIGGDGTLLDVSHSVRTRPLLGVVSSTMSVGHFCATNAQGFGSLLDQWLEGAVQPYTLNRIQLIHNGVPVQTPVLNEVLFAATVPAAVSRYVLQVGEIQETHKSSGVWIATAAGSTAAIRSAGGEVMKPNDKRLQYLVREPYMEPGQTYALQRGTIPGPIEVLSKMRTATAYLDGHREQISLELGDRIRLQPHPFPLNLVGYRRATS